MSMKTATIELRLTKNHHVHKTNITPIECMLLAAEHNVNSQGDPIGPVENVKDVPKVQVLSESGKMVEADWTDDLEIRRLRGIYGDKVKRLDSVRQLPKEYDGPNGAIAMGKAMTSPQSGPSVIAKVEIK